ncbi:hypothetical protein LCGC14_1045870 [marine sediment metagenome]|uniref:Uncharacterized protein n=1 Tax=marine sediment metagenome TaxID=412755 RepID=A0A0F9NC24_9ZZZZ
MNQKQAQLTNVRDRILSKVREIAWQDGGADCPLRRLSRGELVFGDGNLIQQLATLVSAELGIQDEYDKKNRDTFAE